MIILAIETSCDDTCVSVVKTPYSKDNMFEVLSNIISSQTEIHKKYGGVYPIMAKREHQQNIVPVLKKSLERAGLLKTQNIKRKTQNNSGKFKTLEKILEQEKVLGQQLKNFLEKYEKPKVDIIAITNGPGLEPCLWVGVNLAKALSYYWNLPIIPINHIEAHILVNWLKPINKNTKRKNQTFRQIEFPAICLVVSGGHTQLILIKDIGKYKIIGETRDDAAGECFDKTARILGLDYPGGPIIEKQAKKYRDRVSVDFNKKEISAVLPRPMIYQKNYDFSFSGLKTAVLYSFKKEPIKIRKKEGYIQKMCYEIEQAIIDVLIAKTIKACKEYNVKTIMLGGGVAANQELGKQFKQTIKKQLPNLKFYVPTPKLCADNAVMVGVTGYCGCLKGKTKIYKNIKANANLRI
ncbi:MAG: tRNA (adenosine(37)-N6)-threonylcarbamoyltransferase complex transferase subunit TsaD [Patescibacteria group bacterium]|nr:tRNA (adenosine(37)-N6)-threonylcarbamoyltransferase complex transferase subunit TsaD [Patescibacteria group bacterium]